MTHRSSSIARLLLTAILVMAAAYASAQSKATIYIPFSFTANHQTLPAGHYTLELLSDRFLCFSDSRTGGHKAIIMVQPESGPYIETHGLLRFVMREDRHYLTEIRFAGSSMRSSPVVSRSFARELARHQAADSSVDIAMK